MAPEFDRGELAGERAICSTGARFVLHADISRFYPTVYTHSIPWALHGKTDAKKKQKDMSLLGNIIDRGVRRTMAGQTLGIPIGPDSSLVIAEVVGCAMDRAMTEQMPKLRGIRHVDDYHLYFERTGEAERALETLHSIVHDFELELNPNKISIVELPEPIDPVWVSELKLYHFRPNVRSQQNDLISYFSRAFEYAHSFPDSAVLKYALRRIRGVKVHKENWPLYEAFILKCITADPTVIETAIAIFLAYDVVDYPVDRKSIGHVAQEMLTFHSEFKHGYELTWIMFLCKALNIQIESEVAKRLCAVDDPCAAIMTLDLRESGLIPSGLDTSMWESFVQSEGLYSEYWPLAYESHLRNWLNAPGIASLVSADGFWSLLKANAVTFYDQSFTTTPVEVKPADEATQPPPAAGGDGGGY